ncbi:tyrosine-protein phosphatase [Aquibacillus kalidii]|uniref:tyrosine-protein phosphatase n=1 Tax=Aquibacillus kalidii TaxID=2762597 RepID=UPI00164588D7|nr:CpsB/CapC family capsule biosynthesis tyrosine phosphatase [Aquibacillus kalidii]
MIDINCHILPGLDDGAKHMEESIAMAKEALNQGIDKIIATPTHMDGKYHNFKKEIMIGINELNRRLNEEGIDLEVLPGQKIRINGDLLGSMDKDHLLDLNNGSRYILIDLPYNHVPQYTGQVIFDLQLQGYKPILVHPEKHQQFMEEPNALYELVKNGALVQIASDSVVGKSGKKVQKLTHTLIEANLTHFIGSEAKDHSQFTYKKAISELRKRYGNSIAYYYIENAVLLTQGQTVLGDPPTKVSKRKKIMGII